MGYDLSRYEDAAADGADVVDDADVAAVVDADVEPGSRLASADDPDAAGDDAEAGGSRRRRPPGRRGVAPGRPAPAPGSHRRESAARPCTGRRSRVRARVPAPRRTLDATYGSPRSPCS